MTTEGIEAVFLETHNWGKSARFFQGWATKSSSRQTTTPANSEAVTARPCSSPRSPRPSRLDGTSCWPWPMPTPSSSMPPSRSLTDGEDTHWGTRLMTVRDPDGSEWKLQAPK